MAQVVLMAVIREAAVFLGKVVLLAGFLILMSYGLVIAAALWFKVG